MAEGNPAEVGPAYVGYGATYLVPANSPIKSMAEIDQPGRRIIVVVSDGSDTASRIT